MQRMISREPSMRSKLRTTVAQNQSQLNLAAKLRFAFLVGLAALLLLSFSTSAIHTQLPFTGISGHGQLAELIVPNEVPSLPVFRRSVINGKPDDLTGVWVDGLLAYEVVRGDGINVPQMPDTASIYKWADQRGVTALMIHNNLGGSALYELEEGRQIAAIYGDGRIGWYVSRGFTAYEAQAYTVNGFSGPFRPWDCESCSFETSVEEIQAAHYTGSPHLAFQTCLEGSGRMGLIVIEADPITILQGIPTQNR